MTSGFQNPSQTDFVIFKLNEIELWYTARSHSRFWAGFFIACSFSRSLCVSCCECLNLPAILLISDEESCRHFKTFTAGDWAYGCASFYSWLTRKRQLAYIETKAPQYPVSWCGYYFNDKKIIPQARMSSESIVHEAEGRMGNWLRGHKGERNNCFSKIRLVGQKYRDKTTLAS